MKKVFSKDNLNYFIIGLVALTMLLTCSTNRKLKHLKKDNVELSNTVVKLSTDLESVKDSMITREILSNVVELESYKNSYRNIYDNNSIVRTKARPDDVMNKYNIKIEQLTKK